MKIVFVVKYYDGFVESLTQKIAASKINNYEQLQDVLVNESSIIFAPFVHYFRELGHETHLLIPNFKLSQNFWAEENQIHYNDNPITFTSEQVKFLSPDILFLGSNFEYYDSFIDSVRPYVKKVCAWISCPFDKQMNLSKVDHIFTLFKPHFDFFRKKNISTTLTHACFDQRVLNDLALEKKYEFTFIGGIGAHHKERTKILKKLVTKTPLKIWGYGYRSKNFIKNLIKQILTGFKFVKPYQGEAWALNMLKILSQSEITLNVHGDIAQGYAVNMRMFEATGAGTLLLTELTTDINDFFIPDKEVICYSTIEEAIEKVNYYLKHPEERKKISKAGQNKTLNNYTYKNVSIKYIEVFEELLKSNQQS